jgi:hypothetical protein
MHQQVPVEPVINKNGPGQKMQFALQWEVTSSWIQSGDGVLRWLIHFFNNLTSSARAKIGIL